MIQDNDTTIARDRFKEMDAYVKEQVLEELFYAMGLRGHLMVVEAAHLTKKLREMTKKKECFTSSLQEHLNRPIYHIDCAKLCKGDAKGWLDSIEISPLAPRPIIVVENITEIPMEDSIHDNPLYVRNLLFNTLKDTQEDCSVFITWTSKNVEKMKAIYNPADNFTWVGNLDEQYKQFLGEHMDRSWKELENEFGIKL